MNPRKIVCGLVVLFLLSTSYAFADDWPMPLQNLERNAYSVASSPDEPYISWEYAPGPYKPGGYAFSSSPIIKELGAYPDAEYRLFIGRGPSLYCLDLKTKEELWSYYTGCYYAYEVTVDDGKVFGRASGTSRGSYGGLFCLELTTGNRIWYVEPIYGGFSDIAVVEGKVLALNSVWSQSFLPDHTTLKCFDAATGELQWEVRLGNTAQTSSKIVAVNGKAFVNLIGNIVAVDYQTGAILWNKSTGYSMYGLSTSDIYLYTYGHYGYYKDLKKIMCLSQNDGSVVWEYKIEYDNCPWINIGNPVVVNEDVFCLVGKTIYRLNKLTGELVSKYISPPSTFLSSPCIGGNKIFFTGATGYVYAIDLTNDSILWTYYMGGGTNLSRGELALANNQLFVQNKHQLVVLGSKNNLPVVDTGDNLTINSEDKATTIIYSSASDMDDDILTYCWLEGNCVLQDYQPAGLDGSCPLNLANVFGLDVGQHTLTLEVSDGKDIVWASMILTINNSPSVVSPGGMGTYQIGEDIVFIAEVSDYDGDALTYWWCENSYVYNSGTITTIAGGSPVNLPVYTKVGGLSLGEHTITLKVEDGINSVAKSIIIEVIDTQAPTLKPTLNKSILWPPNHEMVDIVIDPNAQDDSGVVNLSADVASSEPEETDGDGNTISDYTEPIIDQTTGIITLQLRAERSGKGTGRTYTIAITASDSSNNTSSAEVKVIAPHDRGKK